MFETYKELLEQFVSYKSISTDPSFKSDIEKTVAWLEQLLSSNGFTVTLVKGKHSNPLVIAQLRHDAKLPTVLVYGHYDIQPADLEDGWSSNPFVLTERSGRLVARGVVDNKGQILAHIVSVIEAHRAKRLAYNVVFVVEGNEESGNVDIAAQLRAHRKELRCDFVMISDGEIVGDYPVIEASLRGGGNIRVQYTTAPSDQHSGLYGGTIPSAAYELTRVLASLRDSKNRVAVPGFYKGAPAITKAQRANNLELAECASVLKLTGTKSLVTEPGVDPYSQIGLRPTLEVTGIRSGYTGEGFKNIVPGYAEARINVRTVAGQDSKQVVNAVVEYLKKATPSYVKATITAKDPYPAIALPVDSPEAKNVSALLERAYGKKVLRKYVGGGIPVVHDFVTGLRVPVLLVSFGNDDCNMHGINENFRITHIKKALKFCGAFWSAGHLPRLSGVGIPNA
jgi:acetylornithine deacetylase/succinyl-diaminopimelate desuccinylase-like protein